MTWIRRTSGMSGIRRLLCSHRDAYGYRDHFGLVDMRCDKCGASWVEETASVNGDA